MTQPIQEEQTYWDVLEAEIQDMRMQTRTLSLLAERSEASDIANINDMLIALKASAVYLVNTLVEGDDDETESNDKD